MNDRCLTVEGKINYAIFKNRPNRFLVNLKLEIGDKIEPAFLHDPGRMKELLVPNARLIIRKPLKPENRKTKWDILAVEHKNRIVTINSILPNRITKKALEEKWIKELSVYSKLKPEISYGKSRLDFLLSNVEENCFVEVKGVTLVENKVALFPDAPTSRGVRHLKELMKLKEEGNRAVILFICMRDDPIKFSSNENTDPNFSKQLKIAYESGVEIFVYKVKPLIKNEHLTLYFKERIDVKL
jgi:sugar fermentation stimulation protein A